MWCRDYMSPYRAGDDTNILGILFEPVVHVLTHSKEVVKAGSLAGRPVTLWHLRQQEKGEMDVSNGTVVAEQQFTCHEESSDRNIATSTSRGAILVQSTLLCFLGRFCQRVAVFYLKRFLQKHRWDAFCSLNCHSDSTVGLMTLEFFFFFLHLERSLAPWWRLLLWWSM